MVTKLKQFIDENRNMEITINLETWMDDFEEELQNIVVDDEKLAQEIYNFSKEKRNGKEEWIKGYFIAALADYRKEIIKDITERTILGYSRKTGNDDIRMLLK